MKSFSTKVRLGAVLGALAVTAPMAAFSGIAGTPSASAHSMSPAAATDGVPQLATASVAQPGFRLRKCQVEQSVGTCYDPYQMRTAYGVDRLLARGYDGTGTTVVIVDAFNSPYVQSDLNGFDSYYGLPATTVNIIAPQGTVPYDPTPGGVQDGWSGEIALDTQWVHAIAPGAKIDLVIAKTSQDSDILAATQYAVDHRLGDVISQSFGENETCVDPSITQQQHAMFQEATSKNITLFASSGDQGAAQQTCDGNSWTQVASSPADDPLVTAVGGTLLNANDYLQTIPGVYQSETAWNEINNTESTGGGFSKLFSKPAYQNSAVPGTARGLPDVAYNAGIYTGVLVEWKGGQFYRFGGTSAGSPQWSAITAIADQMAGHPLGFLNTALYALSASATYSNPFHDISTGNNSVTEYDANGNPVNVSGWNATRGWDPTTGLGSPRADILVPQLIRTVNGADPRSAVATIFNNLGGTGPHRVSPN